MTSQLSDMGEQAKWCHLPPSQMVSNSLTSSSLTSAAPLLSSQLSFMQETTEGADVESEEKVGPDKDKRVEERRMWMW